MPVAAGPIRSAAFQNTLVDIVDWWRQNRMGSGGRNRPSVIPTDVIKVKNISGADRSAGQVLEIGTHLLTTIDRRNLWFNADTVSHAAGRSYCILPRPIPAGEIDDAHISGVCVALVDIQDTADRFAYVETSSNVLKSGTSGQFKLLGPVTATGEQSVAVVFGGEKNAGYFVAVQGDAVASVPPTSIDLDFDAPLFEEGTLFTRSGDTLTVVAPLIANQQMFHVEWVIQTAGSWPASSAQAGTSVRVMKNGVAQGGTIFIQAPSPAVTTHFDWTHSGFIDIYLEEGDEIKLRVFHTGGQTSSTDSQDGYVRFTPIGPPRF